MRQAQFSKRSVLKNIWHTIRLLRPAIRACDTATSPFLLSRRRRLLSEDYAKQARCTSAISTTAFTLNAYSDLRCLQGFQFRRSEVPLIADAVGLVGKKTSRSEYSCSSITAKCILLRRLAYPCRWIDLELDFGMHAPALSEVFWKTIDCLYQKRSHLLTTFRSELLMDRTAEYAAVVEKRGAPLDNSVVFIDCTKIQMCRSGGTSSNHHSVYSGHKRCHCLLYETITTPGSLVFHLFGSVDGLKQDMTLYRMSNMEELF